MKRWRLVLSTVAAASAFLLAFTVVHEMGPTLMVRL
jgi:hypothetical protein